MNGPAVGTEATGRLRGGIFQEVATSLFYSRDQGKARLAGAKSALGESGQGQTACRVWARAEPTTPLPRVSRGQLSTWRIPGLKADCPNFHKHVPCLIQFQEPENKACPVACHRPDPAPPRPGPPPAIICSRVATKGSTPERDNARLSLLNLQEALLFFFMLRDAF